MVLKAYHTNVVSALLFVGGFYVLLVGSKITTALLIDRSRDILKSRGYLFTIKTFGFILLVIALFFVRDGLKLLGVF